MQAIRSILVVLDPRRAEDQALKRAKLIAGATQSRLHLLVCARKTDFQTHLDMQLAELRQGGFEASGEQAWHEGFHETVVAVQQAQGCDLVIKQHIPENPLKKALLTPEDWKLLRYCPCPVLMVKTDAPWGNGVILAAVDVGNSDAEHRTLHAGIIGIGHAMAELAGSSLHVISAHPSPMLSAADPTFQLKETIEARYRKQCQAFQDEFQISSERLHIEEGPADVLIPYTAQRLNAAVTVIGTVARTGLSGALIGNTAEVVLDQLESDVLVIKPEAVMSSLEALVAQR